MTMMMIAIFEIKTKIIFFFMGDLSAWAWIMTIRLKVPAAVAAVGRKGNGLMNAFILGINSLC